MGELTGLRALVVEDEGGVALLIEDMLRELGCEIAASAATLARAMQVARDGDFDFAVLDVNLDGQLVFPVAEILQDRKRPFIFSTGYGDAGLLSSFKGHQLVCKPFAIEELAGKLRVVLGR